MERWSLRRSPSWRSPYRSCRILRAGGSRSRSPSRSWWSPTACPGRRSWPGPAPAPATLDGEVGRLGGRFAPGAVLHEVESARMTVEEAEHRFMPVTAEGKVASLAALIHKESGPVLVFVRTKRGADRLVRRLKAHDV